MSDNDSGSSEKERLVTDRGRPGRRRRPPLEPPGRQRLAELDIPVPSNPLPGEAAPFEYDPDRTEPFSDEEILGFARRQARTKQFAATGTVDESLVPDQLPDEDAPKVQVGIRLSPKDVLKLALVAEAEQTTTAWVLEDLLAGRFALPPRDPAVVREAALSKIARSMVSKLAKQHETRRRRPKSEPPVSAD